MQEEILNTLKNIEGLLRLMLWNSNMEHVASKYSGPIKNFLDCEKLLYDPDYEHIVTLVAQDMLNTDGLPEEFREKAGKVCKHRVKSDGSV